MKLSIQNAHFYICHYGPIGSILTVTPYPINKEHIDDHVVPLTESEALKYMEQGKQVVINPGVNVTAITDQ